MTNIGMLLLRSKSDKWVTDLSSCLKKRFRGKYFGLYFKSFIKRHLQEDGQPISHFLLVECLTWFVLYVLRRCVLSNAPIFTVYVFCSICKEASLSHNSYPSLFNLECSVNFCDIFIAFTSYINQLKV